MASSNTIRQMLGGTGADELARSVGARPQDVAAALEVILPRMSQALERNTLSRGGLADLVKAIGDGHHEAYLRHPEMLASEAARADGNAILGHILGSKESSRSLAAKAAASSGLSESVVRQLLPLIAAMVMGALAKGAKGGLGDILSKLPDLPPGRGGAGPTPVPGGGPKPRMPEPAPRPAGGGYAGGDSPLPIPGDNIPGVGRQQPNRYEDLSDVIRKGGGQIPGGGSLGGVVRDILGGLLGFQSKGFLGWVVRLIVLRWGWGLVQWILRRLLIGR